MAQFSVEEILAATGGTLVQGSETVQVEGVSIDSRTIAPGMLFIPLQGEKSDGHAYIGKAIQAGAGAVLTAVPVALESSEIPCVQVEDTLLALQQLANYHRRRFQIPVIAVTGSNGKTTTKDMVAEVLSTKYQVCKTQKNYNNEIGLPLTLLSLQESDEACVVEMGMRGLGQIAELAKIAEPTIGVVTNVGVAHLELLETQENIARAKGELVEALPSDGTAVLNMDDERVAGMQGLSECRVIGYGMGSQAAVQALDLQFAEGGTDFMCRSFDEVFAVHLPVAGKHNVYNALAAIAVARVLGVSAEKIRKALAHWLGGEMRQEKMELDGICFINDAYNANPVSVLMAIESLPQFGEGRKFVVLGDMLELGPTAADWHYRMGEAVAAAGVTGLVGLGELAAEAVRAASESGVPHGYACRSHADAMAWLKAHLQEGDIVLLKGSRAMHLEDIIEQWKEGRN